MVIDTHVHLWRLDRGDYSWLTPARPRIHRDFLPGDIWAAQEDLPISGIIAVQAAPTWAETDWLLEQAAAHPWIVGVTGWADLTAPDARDVITEMARNPRLKGLRPMEGVATGPEWLSTEAYADGLAALAKTDLVLEALALPHHLRGLAAVAEYHIDLPIIINHAAKPTPATVEAWRQDLAAFADLPNVICKMSGFTAQSRDDAFHQHVWDMVYGVFGPDRMMWGSDFPVLQETSTYQAWFDLSERLAIGMSQDERDQVFQGTAARCYGLNEEQTT